MKATLFRSHLASQRMIMLFLMLTVMAVFLLLSPDSAFASEGTGGGLPYESWLTKLTDSVTGPFAFSVAIISLVVAGATLIFGGEISGFFKHLLYLICVMSLVIGTPALMSNYLGRGAEAANTIEVYFGEVA